MEIEQKIQQTKDEFPSKSLINRHLIKNVNQKMVHNMEESIQLEQIEDSGMYFQEVVLVRIVCDKKSQFTEVVEHDLNYRLTTQAFGNIPVANINKVKLYANKVPKRILLKIQEDDEQHPYIFHIHKQDIRNLFSMLLWVRLATLNIFADINVVFKQQVTGQAFKRVQLFGKWQKFAISISQKYGLVLKSKQKNKVVLQQSSLNQFWTRFEMIEDEAYLVLKLWSGFFKYEIGIPIDKNVLVWMQAFCSILTK